MIKKYSNINIAYFIGRYLLAVIIPIYLINKHLNNNILILLILMLLEYFIVKYAVIYAIEKENSFTITKSSLDGIFIITTSLFLIIIMSLLRYEWYLILIMVVYHSLLFNKMDANDEKKNKKSYEEMKKYLKNKK